jgi:glycosyltransferase involved in cell wall biosynthesis
MASATAAVILYNVNRARDLPGSLEAIFRQTRPADQVVVIDDGSTDDSLAVIEAAASAENRLLPRASSDRSRRWSGTPRPACPSPGCRSCRAEPATPYPRRRWTGTARLPCTSGVPAAGNRRPADEGRLPPDHWLLRPAPALGAAGRGRVPAQAGLARRLVRLSSRRFGFVACVVPDPLRPVRVGSGPYWPRGVRDPASQGAAIAATLDLLAQPRFRDVRAVFRRCPEHFLPWRIPMWWSSCADGATGTSGWRT